MRNKIVKFVIILAIAMLLTSCGCKHENVAIINSKDASCAEAGYTGDQYCYDCEKTIKAGKEISALPHNAVLVYACEANCQKEGYSGDEVCSGCGLVLHTGFTIEKIPHTEELYYATDPSCSHNGYTGDIICSMCYSVIEEGEEIPALEHQWSVTGYYESTCYETGFSGTAVCDVCGTIEEGEVIPFAEHNYNEKNECTVCSWKRPGLYVSDELIISWEELKEAGYVTVDSHGELKSVSGNMNMGTLVIGEDVIIIDGNYEVAFKNDTLQEVWIPRSVKNLGNYLVYNNKSIRKIVVLAEIKKIMSKTFYGGKALETVILPEGIEYIGEGAFSGSPNLVNVRLPSTVKEIGREAFHGWSGESFDLPESLEYIGLSAFGRSNLKSITIPAKVNEIRNGAFGYCKNLTTVDMSACSGLQNLENSVFRECTNLSTLILPPNLIYMGTTTTSDCPMLKTLEFPDGFVQFGIGNIYDHNTTALETVTIPTSMIEMGDLCFNNNIKHINYRGTEAQWMLCTGSGQFPNATITYEYQK